MACVNPGRGRPRSSDRTDAILSAAHDVLHEGGYDNLRMQDVADRAGAGLATIYRRWPAKPDLVAAVLLHHRIGDVELTGDSRADLRMLAIDLARELGTKGEFMAGFIAAVRDHEVIRDAVRVAVIEHTRALFKTCIIDIVGRDDVWVDYLADSVHGVLMQRGGLMAETVDHEVFADELLSLVDALAAG